MNIEQAKQLAKYRLFRPLAFESEHYGSYGSDRDLAVSIAKWASNVLLAGNTYDLGVQPEGVFQIPSTLLNRKVYMMPVWNGELVREIVLRANKKTKHAWKGCGLGDIEELKYVGGLLFLKRVFFRGTRLYRSHHHSDTGWFVEDRYHLDVFVQNPAREEEPEVKQDKSTKGHMPIIKPLLEILLRVYHDSVGCVVTPRWAPDPDINIYNQSIKDYAHEYFPEAREIVMDWHELAEYLQVHNTGIYALCNFTATELEKGRHYLAVGKSFFWGETTAAGTTQETDLSLADDTLWTDPGQPLSQDLVRSYDWFLARFLVRPNDQFLARFRFPIDTYSKTRLFNSNLSAALVQFLLSKADGSAAYIGNGFFQLMAGNALSLAAGTGNWGSAENSPIEITEKPEDEEQQTGVAGPSDPTGGGTRLIVDGLRYLQKEKIAEEIAECRTQTSAECKECVDGSLGDTYHDLGVAADAVDMVAGIAACVLTAIFAPPAAPFVCGVTLPAAGAAAENLWENTFGDYDYAEDMCSGLPDQSPYVTVEEEEDEEDRKRIEDLKEKCRKEHLQPVVERIVGTISCSTDVDALGICMEKSTYKDDPDMRLIGALCIPEKKEGEGDTVICVYCKRGVA